MLFLVLVLVFVIFFLFFNYKLHFFLTKIADYSNSYWRLGGVVLTLYGLLVILLSLKSLPFLMPFIMSGSFLADLYSTIAISAPLAFPLLLLVMTFATLGLDKYFRLYRLREMICVCTFIFFILFGATYLL